MDDYYVSRDTGVRVQAHPVTQNVWVTDFDGNKVLVEPGEYLITEPFVDHMDELSFELEYEHVGTE